MPINLMIIKRGDLVEFKPEFELNMELIFVAINDECDGIVSVVSNPKLNFESMPISMEIFSKALRPTNV